MGSYKAVYQRSLEEPEAFWLQAAGLIDWNAAPSAALDASTPPFCRWFPDGELNTCANALDRHVSAGHGDRVALIWDSALVPARKSFTYRELRESALATHPDVAECAVIEIPDPIKGQVPFGLVVLKAGADPDPGQLRAELTAAVRRDVGPVASFRDVAVVAALPKTRSGKVLRKTMRAIADGKDEPVPATIEDPAVLDSEDPAVLDSLTPVLRTARP